MNRWITLGRKGLNAKENFPKEKFVHAYTDGSSDKTNINGGSSVFLAAPDNTPLQCKFGARNTASNFTCELRAILEALNMYKGLPITKQAEGLKVFCESKAAFEAITKGHSSITHEIIPGFQNLHAINKTRTLQWIPAHFEIAGNENADKLAKETRNLNTHNHSVSLLDANAAAKSKLREKSIQAKHQLCEINAERLITKTIIRLRTGLYRGMKIN